MLGNPSRSYALLDLPSSKPEPAQPSAAEGRGEFLVVAPRRGVFEHLQLIWHQRELLASLVRRELKVKYKNSSLGFVWSLLNPILYLVVYYYVFQVMLGSGIENFPIFLLSGLLIWSLFATSLSAGTVSMVANGALVKKVYFPRDSAARCCGCRSRALSPPVRGAPGFAGRLPVVS